MHLPSHIVMHTIHEFYTKNSARDPKKQTSDRRLQNRSDERLIIRWQPAATQRRSYLSYIHLFEIQILTVGKNENYEEKTERYISNHL